MFGRLRAAADGAVAAVAEKMEEIGQEEEEEEEAQKGGASGGGTRKKLESATREDLVQFVKKQALCRLDPHCPV